MTAPNAPKVSPTCDCEAGDDMPFHSTLCNRFRFQQTTTTDMQPYVPPAGATQPKEQEWPHTDDAATWAEEFAKRHKDPAAYITQAWFQIAIMAGYDTATARMQAKLAAAEKRLAELEADARRYAALKTDDGRRLRRDHFFRDWFVDDEPYESLDDACDALGTPPEAKPNAA